MGVSHLELPCVSDLLLCSHYLSSKAVPRESSQVWWCRLKTVILEMEWQHVGMCQSYCAYYIYTVMHSFFAVYVCISEFQSASLKV